MPENPEITYLLRDVQFHEGMIEKRTARIEELKAEIAASHEILQFHERNLRAYMRDWPRWRVDRLMYRMSRLGIHLDVFSEKPSPKVRKRKRL